MIIGFGWGGWVLGSNSLNLGEEMAEEAVLGRLTPICVAQFNQDPQRDEKFKVLEEKNKWEQDDYVIEQGWATMPFDNEPDNLVAEKCTTLILNNNQ
jgi:hypothetical protein